MSNYKRPTKNIHRGFVYLNDETVINSLSAVEAGKIDEISAKVNPSREGGLGAGIGLQGTKVEAGRKSSSDFAEEMKRTRTRFSAFETWHQTLVDGKALGTFDGWGPDALKSVRPGDTITMRATLQVAPVQTLLRLFLWHAEQAKSQGTLFSQKGDDLKGTKEAEKAMRVFLGSETDDRVTVLASPIGDEGPAVGMDLSREWLIGKLGRLSGEYTVLAQVEQIIDADAERPTLRLAPDVAPTPLELNLLKGAMQTFIEPAANIGIELTGSEASIAGPALWLDPIAIFR